MNHVDDILLIDKPTGITSFDVIRRLRNKLGIKKMGHAGTLDPRATGLMIIGVGQGTKRLHEYIKLPKTYEATIRLGERRTTGDLEGEVIETAEVGEVDEEVVRTTLEDMVGVLTLPVSAYSAIKKDGVPMYKRARAAAKEGREVDDVPIREMEVQRVTLNNIRNSTVNRTNSSSGGESDETHRIVEIDVVFDVGSGTYIRSLAEELGRRLGYPATLASLRRTRIGNFSIEDSQNLV